MKITKIPTVTVEQLTGDCPNVLEAFDCADFNVSFGDANHTLVDKEKFEGMLKDAGLSWDKNTLNMEQTPLDFELIKVYNRLDSLKNSNRIKPKKRTH